MRTVLVPVDRGIKISKHYKLNDLDTDLWLHSYETTDDQVIQLGLNRIEVTNFPFHCPLPLKHRFTIIYCDQVPFFSILSSDLY